MHDEAQMAARALKFGAAGYATKDSDPALLLMACALFIAGVGQVLQLLPGLAPALCRELNLAGQVGGTGELVEQATVSVGLEQRLVFMLAVDVDEQFAQGFQVALGAGRWLWR